MVARSCDHRDVFIPNKRRQAAVNSAGTVKTVRLQTSFWESIVRCFLQLFGSRKRRMTSALGFGTPVTNRVQHKAAEKEEDARLVACEKALYYIMQSVEVRSHCGKL